MNEEMLQYYMETSVYTDVGIYKEFILSLPNLWILAMRAKVLWNTG
ncbi:MAG: hypothetical protein K2K90_07220 [Lachnospiraceae bacterium]|nr:hypothetical protein [Lachnospiraceae bacterium]